MGKTAKGICFGLLTGMLWGIVFLPPQILSDFSPVDIALGRFFFFGLVSLTAIRPVWKMFRNFTAREKFSVLLFSASGFWFYTILLFYGIQVSGGVAATLFMSFYCVTIPLAAKRLRNMRGSFVLGLALLVLGIFTLQLPAVLSGDIARGVPWQGLLVLSLSVGMWTWFALKNSAFLQKHPGLSRGHMVSLMGILSGAALLAITAVNGHAGELMQHPQLPSFLFWTAAIGLGGTWLANWFWNKCCSLCPPAISGPLVVTETIFGLAFTFIYQQRWPEIHETAAILLFAIGVCLAVRAEMKETQA